MAMFLNLTCIFMCLVIKTASSSIDLVDFEQLEKCCDYESILNDSIECTRVVIENVDNGTVPKRPPDVGNETELTYRPCLKNGTAAGMMTGAGNYSNYNCVDILANGTRVQVSCELKPNGLNETFGQCDSLFSQINFWGASMVVFVTIIYNIPFVLVVIIYSILPELRCRAYDRAVSNYNVCYMVTNFLLVILGLCTLCHSRMSATTYRLFGLSLMFWTQGAVSWLFIICFDMTLVITRFRWAPKGGAERFRCSKGDEQENHELNKKKRD